PVGGALSARRRFRLITSTFPDPLEALTDFPVALLPFVPAVDVDAVVRELDHVAVLDQVGQVLAALAEQGPEELQAPEPTALGLALSEADRRDQRRVGPVGVLVLAFVEPRVEAKVGARHAASSNAGI